MVFENLGTFWDFFEFGGLDGFRGLRQFLGIFRVWRFGGISGRGSRVLGGQNGQQIEIFGIFWDMLAETLFLVEFW